MIQPNDVKLSGSHFHFDAKLRMTLLAGKLQQFSSNAHKKGKVVGFAKYVFPLRSVLALKEGRQLKPNPDVVISRALKDVLKASLFCALMAKCNGSEGQNDTRKNFGARNSLGG